MPNPETLGSMQQQKKDLMAIFENLRVSNLYGVHIFIDYSNVEIGASKYCRGFDNERFLEFIESITSSLPHIKKIAVSSASFSAEKYGYEVHKLPKYQRKELFVDELLYAKIGDSLLDYEKGFLLVVTGDGNISNYGLGFSVQIVRAILRNWTVRLLTWRGDVASIYIDIEKKYPNFSIYYIDAALSRLI